MDIEQPPTKKSVPLELLVTIGRVVVVLGVYLLGLRRRRRYGDKL